MSIVSSTIDTLCLAFTEFSDQYDLLRTLEVALYRLSTLPKDDNSIGGFLRTTLKKKLRFKASEFIKFSRPKEKPIFINYIKEMPHTKISSKKSGQCAIFSYQTDIEFIKNTFKNFGFAVSEHLNLKNNEFINMLSKSKLDFVDFLQFNFFYCFLVSREDYEDKSCFVFCFFGSLDDNGSKFSINKKIKSVFHKFI